METKFSYKVKLEIIHEMEAKIAGLREDLARLSNYEMLAADPNAEEFYAMGTILDDLESEVDDLLVAVEASAFFEKKSA